MKKVFTLLCIMIGLCQIMYAQAPARMNYQAVIRDGSEKLLTNTTIGIRIQVRQQSANGAIVYGEHHNVTTNKNGLATLIIGSGQIITGSFSGIDWSKGPYYIQTETDVNGGTNYTISGTNELLSVPFALHAANGGVPGPQGAQGVQGTQGPQGPQGPIGPQGVKGNDGSGVKIVGSVNTINDLNPNYTGGIGDMFITQNDGKGHVWDGTKWVAIGQIKGPEGPQGIAGPTGPQGPKGDQGTQGIAGPQGNSGPQGNAGSQGVKGDPGAQGVAGPQGTKGDAGAQGPAGSQGAKGDQGVQGLVGPQGPAGTYIAGNGISIAANTISATDASATNELQTISLSGNNLTLNQGGGVVDLSSIGNSIWSLNGNKAYYNGGFVGIGTNNPDREFHLQSANDARMKIQSMSGANNGAEVRLLRNNNASTLLLDLHPSTSFVSFADGTPWANAGILTTLGGPNKLAINSDNGPMHLMTLGNTRMYIADQGKVGIGTTTPGEKLDVVGDIRITDSTPGIQFYNGNTWKGYMYHDGTDLISGNVSLQNILFQTNATTIGKLNWDGLTISRPGKSIELGSPNGGNAYMRIMDGNLPNHLNIRSKGVSISEAGTTTSDKYPFRVVQSELWGLDLFNSISEKHWEIFSNSSGSLTLYANGFLRGTFDGTNGAYYAASDARFKSNIVTLEPTLDKVMSLKPSRYTYLDNNPNNKSTIGFIAQEVKSLFPELVLEIAGNRDEGMLTVNYAGFSVLSVKAIQEQQIIIDQQAIEIKSLKHTLQQIEQRLTHLESK